MSLTALILILLSAGLHACWNFISKSSKPSALFFLIATCASLVLFMPFLIWSLNGTIFSLPGTFWILLVVTGFFQTLYYVGLASAYRCGDISLVYPLVRALPVLIVPSVCFLIAFGERLSAGALGGMFLICAGCVVIPMNSFSEWNVKDYTGPAMRWVVPAAVGTVGYTITDSAAIKMLSDAGIGKLTPLVYTSWEAAAILPWLILCILFFRRERGQRRNFEGKRILKPVSAGIICTISYLLVLASMLFVSNVSYVAAFRQLSIPLGVILGVVILKEKITVPRFAGTCLIVAGLVFTAIF
jgi:drug/metabolite transporter (DMT)-like permease